MTGRRKGATACDGQAHQCFHRRPICQGPRSLLRPPSLRSPSRCPRPVRRSPGKRTSSCSHTCGVRPEPLPESELPPARRTRTSGAGQKSGRGGPAPAPPPPRPGTTQERSGRTGSQSARTKESPANLWVSLSSFCGLPGRSPHTGL